MLGTYCRAVDEWLTAGGSGRLAVSRQVISAAGFSGTRSGVAKQKLLPIV